MLAKLTRDPPLTLSVLGLAALTVLVARRRTARLDRRWSAHAGKGKPLAVGISRAGKPTSGFFETVALAALPRLGRPERLMTLAAPLLSAAVGHALKLLVPRRRPGWAGWGANGNQSFPSTHAGHVGALAFTAAQVAREHGASAWAEAAAASTVAVMALARVRAKAHWPTDVVAGAMLGLASARLARAFTRPSSSR